MIGSRRSLKNFDSLFSPVAFTPSQHADLYGDRLIEYMPEAALMLAVLENALSQWRKFLPYADHMYGKQQKMFKEVDQWFRDKSVSWLYSFENICLIINLDPNAVRKMLAEWKLKPSGLSRFCNIRTRAVNSLHRVLVIRP